MHIFLQVLTESKPRVSLHINGPDPTRGMLNLQDLKTTAGSLLKREGLIAKGQTLLVDVAKAESGSSGVPSDATITIVGTRYEIVNSGSMVNNAPSTSEMPPSSSALSQVQRQCLYWKPIWLPLWGWAQSELHWQLQERLPAQPEMVQASNIGRLTCGELWLHSLRKIQKWTCAANLSIYQQRGSRLQLYDHEVRQLLDGFVMAKVFQDGQAQIQLLFNRVAGQLAQAAQEGRLPYLELVNLCGMY
ncbi:hypothetical protein BJ742DRAFT_745812 [Cladochytrium replicatum]|nr:hypothetical protein BJ742DRAFT_745812 [Cladochytrium replicatum]